VEARYVGDIVAGMKEYGFGIDVDFEVTT